MVEALAQDPLRLDTLTWMASYSPLVARPGTPIVDFLEMGKLGEDPRFYLSWYGGDFSTDPDFQDPNMAPERRANPTWDADREAYLKQQRRRLPAAQYKRLHLNLPGPAKGAKFDPEAVLAAVAKGRKRLAFDPTLEYIVACDHSGGQNDAAVLAIGHRDPESERIVLDLLQVYASPHIPRDAVNGFCATMKSWNTFVLHGDNYGGRVFSSDYRTRGISYQTLTVSKSILYDALEPALADGNVELLDIPELVDEALGLIEKNGKTDHVPGMFDDRINAVAALVYIARKREAEGPWPAIFVATNDSHPHRDRWAPDYNDYHAGSSAWVRERTGGRDW
jgi:hypothetical protein